MRKPSGLIPCCRISGTFITLLSTLILGLYIIRNWITPCYFMSAGDWLPSAEDPSFAPPERSIFFHETSCAGGLSVRQACAVEAAARAHPQRQVYVLFSSPVTYYTLRTSCLEQLRRLRNVRLARLHVADYAKGTVAHSTLLNVLEESSCPIEHSADILRLMTLRKWGGIYLDSDMIVTRSLDNLPINFLAKEDANGISTGILSFGKDTAGSNMSDAIINNLLKQYHPQIRTSIGGPVFDHVIKELCPELTDSKDDFNNPINICKGVTIFDSELFYSTKWRQMFRPPVANEFDLERPYTYHMCSHVTNSFKINKGTVYEIIARRYCPYIYHAYGEEFGVE